MSKDDQDITVARASLKGTRTYQDGDNLSMRITVIDYSINKTGSHEAKLIKLIDDKINNLENGAFKELQSIS